MSAILFDYGALRLIWWVLMGVMLIGFAVGDGFDMGVGALLPFVARTDIERRVAINTIGPVWEGNQAWLVLGGGAIFAAWPALYAVSFSGFYLAMFLVLLALVLRPVAFKYRSKDERPAWRSGWDWALFAGSAVPALIFGVAVGNALQGVPFHFTDDLRPIYEGNLFGLLNPLALYCGLLSVAMLVTHGAAWLVLKAEGPVAVRASSLGFKFALATAVLFACGGFLVMVGAFRGYQLVTVLLTDGPSNPTSKQAIVAAHAWLGNFAQIPVLWAVPLLGVAAPLAAAFGFRSGRGWLTFLSSMLGIAMIISTVGLSMFPFILPSSTNPSHSLTVWDASSSESTLRTMLIVTVIFLPIVLAYTAWVYRVLRGKVSDRQITAPGSPAY